MDFALHGLQDALAAVKRVAASVTDASISKEAMRALEPVVADARRLAPVDRGTLRDSIGIAGKAAKGSSTDGQMVFVGILEAGGPNDAFYAHFHEFGTVTMRATPFLGPALHRNEKLIFEVLGTRVGKSIEAAA